MTLGRRWRAVVEPWLGSRHADHCKTAPTLTSPFPRLTSETCCCWTSVCPGPPLSWETSSVWVGEAGSGEESSGLWELSGPLQVRPLADSLLESTRETAAFRAWTCDVGHESRTESLTTDCEGSVVWEGAEIGGGELERDVLDGEENDVCRNVESDV